MLVLAICFLTTEFRTLLNGKIVNCNLMTHVKGEMHLDGIVVTQLMAAISAHAFWLWARQQQDVRVSELLTYFKEEWRFLAFVVVV